MECAKAKIVLYLLEDKPITDKNNFILTSKYSGITFYTFCVFCQRISLLLLWQGRHTLGVVLKPFGYLAFLGMSH